MRSLGKKPHFGAFPEAQKGVLICAICLHKAAHWPNNNANPSGLSEKTVYCVESLALSAACTKLPNAFNPFGTIRKKFLLCKSTKKARYVRSLGKKPHFGAFPEAQKGVLICAICLRKAAHWPNNNANPSGLSEKTVYCVESLRFCR